VTRTAPHLDPHGHHPHRAHLDHHLDRDPRLDDHTDLRGDPLVPESAQRFDPLSLVFGLVFLGFAGLALDGRPLDVSASFVIPAALAGLAVWLVVDAITGRRDGAA
jgi:hypothetical protein